MTTRYRDGAERGTRGRRRSVGLRGRGQWPRAVRRKYCAPIQTCRLQDSAPRRDGHHLGAPVSKALAVCDPAAGTGRVTPPPGTTVTCRGTTTTQNPLSDGYGTGQQNGLTVNVLSGASITTTGSGIALADTNTINNSGAVSGVRFGLVVGNENTVNNPARSRPTRASTAMVRPLPSAIPAPSQEPPARAFPYSIISRNGDNRQHGDDECRCRVP